MTDNNGFGQTLYKILYVERETEREEYRIIESELIVFPDCRMWPPDERAGKHAVGSDYCH